MAQKIIWSARAIKNLDAVTKYLLEKFGENSVYTLHSPLSKKLSLIQSNPQLYRANIALVEWHWRSSKAWRPLAERNDDPSTR